MRGRRCSPARSSTTGPSGRVRPTESCSPSFDVRGGDGAVRAQAAGLFALGIALAITSGSIAGLHAIAPRAARALEVAVLVGANALATAVRFVVLRTVIDRPLPGTLR